MRSLPLDRLKVVQGLHPHPQEVSTECNPLRVQIRGALRRVQAEDISSLGEHDQALQQGADLFFLSESPPGRPYSFLLHVLRGTSTAPTRARFAVHTRTHTTRNDTTNWGEATQDNMIPTRERGMGFSWRKGGGGDLNYLDPRLRHDNESLRRLERSLIIGIKSNEREAAAWKPIRKHKLEIRERHRDPVST